MIWEKGLRLKLFNLIIIVVVIIVIFGKVCIIGYGKVGFEKFKGMF